MSEQEVDLKQLDEDVRASITEEAPTETPTTEPTDQLTAAEQEAMEKGWNPEGVEGKRNLSAEEFLDRESFFDEIHKLKREVRTQKEMVDALKQHNSQVSEKAYEKAVRDLKAQKRVAASNEDLSAVIQIDEQIEELRDAKAQQEAQAPAPAQSYSQEDWGDAFEAFRRNNEWYTKDRVKTAFADSIGVQYANTNPTATPEAVYKYVASEVRKEFSDGQTKPKAAAVAPAGRSSGKPQAKKYTLADVPEEDREIAKIVISSGVSEEDYLKQYFQ